VFSRVQGSVQKNETSVTSTKKTTVAGVVSFASLVVDFGMGFVAGDVCWRVILVFRVWGGGGREPGRLRSAFS
jgi:hypothetical protein